MSELDGSTTAPRGWRWLGVLVGLGMTLGFGALTVGTVREYRAFPATPRAMTVAEAAGQRDPGDGAWVTLTDLRLPCSVAMGEGSSGSNRYRVGTGADGTSRVVIAAAVMPACGDSPRPMTGVLASSSVGRIVGLEFPGHPWSAWPTPWQITLWTHAGPDDSRTGFLILPWMTLIGVIVTAFYAWPTTQPRPRRARPLPSLDPGRIAHARASASPAWVPILPRRPLSFAAGRWRQVAFSALTLSVFGALLATLGLWAVVDRWQNLSGSGVVGYVVALLLGAIGLLGLAMFPLAGLLVARTAKAARAFRGRWVEVLIPIDAVVDVEVNHLPTGVHKLLYKTPHEGKSAEVTVSAIEQPIVFEGYLLGAYPEGDPAGLVILQEGYLPFALTDDEVDRAEEALAARRGAVEG